jgi:hypothetical protein
MDVEDHHAETSDSVQGLQRLDYLAHISENVDHGIILHRDISRFKGISSIANSMKAPAFPSPPPTNEQLDAVWILLSNDLLDTPTGINVAEFIVLTLDHPNQPLIKSIVRALSVGASSNTREFPIDNCAIRPNHKSATDAMSEFDKNMEKEIAAGRRVELPQHVQDRLPYLNSNPIGAVFKNGKVRMINDQSYPKGRSVNDFIDGKDFGQSKLDDTRHVTGMLKEMNIEETDLIILGTEDINSFYRHIPVMAHDQLLQLVQHKGVIYLDRSLVFGSRAAPFQACLFADVICWILETKYGLLAVRHYVDNFIYFTLSHRAKSDQTSFLNCMERLNIPLNVKDRQLGSKVAHLGFEMDTRSSTISVPTATRLKMALDIGRVLKDGGLSFKSLEILNGRIVWVCSIIPIAWVYAKMIWAVLTKAGQRGVKYIVLSKFVSLQRSLQWFRDMLTCWCGISYNMESRWEAANAIDFDGCSSDASKLGGAFVTVDSYSWWSWCPCCVEKCQSDMTPLELGSILIGYTTKIGGIHSGKLIFWLTDNGAATTAFNKGYSADSLTSEIVAELRFELIRSQVDNFRLLWTPRKGLAHADILTRASLEDEQRFLSLPGNEARSYYAPYSTRSIKLLKSDTKPYMFGFTRYHP